GGQKNISRHFGDEDMTRDMSLLNMDSIEMVEFCEYLEEDTGMTIDFDWLLGCENMSILVNRLAELLAQPEPDLTYS
ncbi:MAG: phosphopantetheine-binding protein, partial [Gammaproteobacteria bacterium]